VSNTVSRRGLSVPFTLGGESQRLRRFSLQRAAVRGLLLGLLVLLAFGARFDQLTEPPLDFHPARQYRSALIARGLYADALPAPEAEVARLSAERQGLIEPPIMEILAALGYRVAGGEHLWLPRALSSVFWVAGGLFIFLIARRLFSEAAALVSSAFYLFIPFGVEASRSFQPDPLMVMLMVASVWSIVRYWDRPGPAKWALATALSACALFVKPVCLFVVFGAFGALALHRLGLRQALWRPPVLVFGIASLAPTLAYWIYGVYIDGFLRGQETGRFVPALLATEFFWRGWLEQIREVLGTRTLLVATLGLLLARGTARALLLGLWGGYIGLAMVFTFHTPTHDYYHLPLLPIVALTFAPLLAWRLRAWPVGAVALMLIGIPFAVTLVGRSATLANPAFQHPATAQIRSWREIGELVDHSTKVVYLEGNYGVTLEYYGFLSGTWWPKTWDQEATRLMGGLAGSVPDTFARLKQRVDPDYFVVADVPEFMSQPELRAFLTARSRVMAETSDYIIFDLRTAH
jgi:Dolichyl-phosphate-mannose-protein mannosyltransferase